MDRRLKVRTFTFEEDPTVHELTRWCRERSVGTMSVSIIATDGEVQLVWTSYETDQEMLDRTVAERRAVLDAIPVECDSECAKQCEKPLGHDGAHSFKIIGWDW